MGSSDYECLVWSYIYYDNFILNALALNKFNYAKGDYKLMNQYLPQVDWHNLLISLCVEENWLIFKETLITATNQFVPTTLFKPKTVIPHGGLNLSQRGNEETLFIFKVHAKQQNLQQIIIILSMLNKGT